MSEKIRLYKIAERRQVDRLNYYANLFSDNQHPNALGSGLYWEDGVITDADEVTVISENVTWDNSVDVNTTLTIAAGVVLTINGILTVNTAILNYGHIIVNGLLIKSENITTYSGGTVTVN